MNRPAEWLCIPLIQTTAEYFSGKGIAAARLEAELLLSHATGLTRIELLTRMEYLVRDPELSRFRDLVRRRAMGEPVAYLTGTKEFWSLPFAVTPAVLVPRPETETLVDVALQFLKTRGGKTRVLDIGTGSGCIAVALAHTLPSLSLTATDISREALQIAARNAVTNGVEARITFREGPLYAPVRGERFTCIVSNPPYIAQDDPAVEPGVRRFEPAVALFAGADGLEVLRGLAAGLAEALEPAGAAFFEIGADQAQAAYAIFSTAGFAGCSTLRDLAGKPRVIKVSHLSDTQGKERPEIRVEPLPDQPDDDSAAGPASESTPTGTAKLSAAPSDTSDDAIARLLDAYAEGGEDEPDEPDEIA